MHQYTLFRSLHANTYTHTHTHTHTRTRTHTQTHTYTLKHTHTLACAHTNNTPVWICCQLQLLLFRVGEVQAPLKAQLQYPEERLAIHAKQRQLMFSALWTPCSTSNPQMSRGQVPGISLTLDPAPFGQSLKTL